LQDAVEFFDRTTPEQFTRSRRTDVNSNELLAHSLAEAYLYVMASPCPSCGKGPLRGGDTRKISENGNTCALSLSATCGNCGRRNAIVFRLDRDAPLSSDGPYTVVNPSDEPSRILDVAQWITLFRVITEAASHERNKMEARRLGLEAAQCLEEAIKFYDDAENDLPPPEAFFSEDSRGRFREHPEHFSRTRLLQLRAKLPATSVMQNNIARPKKRRWWSWKK